MKKTDRWSLMMGAASTLALSLAAPALGQEADQEDGRSRVLQTVQVTAERREASQQDVPITVSTIDDRMLSEGDYRTSEDLALQVPGLQIKSSFSASNPTIFIRGVGINDFNPANSGAIGVMVDDMFYNSTTGQLFQLFDLDRVEVLKGPQGTLYGRNTTGGVLSVHTKEPGFETGGYVTATYGRFNQLDLEGAVTLPVNDKLAFRVSGVSNTRDGTRDIAFPDGTSREKNDVDFQAGRVQMLFEPTTELKILGKLEYGKSSATSRSYESQGLINFSTGQYGLDDYGGVCGGRGAAICGDAFGYVDNPDPYAGAENIKDTPEEVEAFTEIWRDARQLIEEERFLNWQIAFPGVWQDWASAERKGGFDAIVGNPPWDRFEFEEIPWFAARDPQIALEPLKSKRQEMIAALKELRPDLLRQFNEAQERRTQASKIVRSGGAYCELNSGKLNIYKIFVERSRQLIRENGMIGLLTPIGIGTDHNVSSFIQNVTAGDHLKAFIAFENRRHWLFEDVHAEDQPTVFILGGKSRRFRKFDYAVKLHQLPTHEDAPQPVELSKETLNRLNPNTGTMPILRTTEGLRLLTKAYDDFPILIEGQGRNERPLYPIRYRQMVNMTSRSEGFRTAKMLTEQEGAWPVGEGCFQSAKGLWLRLYEGKMVSIYNHRYAGVRNPTERISGQGVAVHSNLTDLENPDFLPVPRYWILESDADPDFPYAIGFNDICNTNNSRSVISAVVPRGAYGNKLPILTWDKPDAHQLTQLQANLASSFTDFVARQKIQSRSLNKYILAQLPIIPPEAYSRKFGSKIAADIVREAVLELTYTAHDMAPFARDLGHVDAKGEVLPPFKWDEERRFTLRAKLDALYFILYGVWDAANPAKSREDIHYIYSTFPIVERDERARYDQRYRSPELALLWINALMAGQPDADIRD